MFWQGVPGGFYRLVLELVSVEVQVLLVDALRGPVPTMPVLRHQSAPPIRCSVLLQLDECMQCCCYCGSC